MHPQPDSCEISIRLLNPLIKEKGTRICFCVVSENAIGILVLPQENDPRIFFCKICLIVLGFFKL